MTAALARAALNRGLAARAAGNDAAALKAFETAIGLDAESPLGYLYAADMHLRQLRHNQAISLAHTALGLPCGVSNRSLGLRIVAIAQINLKQRKRAVATAADAVRNDPENAANRRVNAQALWSAQRLRPAEAAFKESLALDGSSVVTLTTYARFLKTLGRLREAEDMVGRAALVQPDAIDVIMLRGQIAFSFDRLEEARDMALWALSRNAMDRKALELLARVQSRCSWLAKPFWMFSGATTRHRRRSIAVFVLLGASVGALTDILFSSQLADDVDAAMGDVLLLFALYAVACGLHVIWLTRRDLRQVKLKAF